MGENVIKDKSYKVSQVGWKTGRYKMRSLQDDVVKDNLHLDNGDENEEECIKVTDGTASDEFIIDADSDSEQMETKGKNGDNENDDDAKEDGINANNDNEIIIKIDQNENEDQNSDDDVIEQMQTKGRNDDIDSMYEEPMEQTKGNSMINSKVCLL